MKRLLDDASNETGRRLLEAGRDIHPEAIVKAALLAKIGDGSAGLAGTQTQAALRGHGTTWGVNLTKFGLLGAAGALATAGLLWQPSVPARPTPAVQTQAPTRPAPETLLSISPRREAPPQALPPNSRPALSAVAQHDHVAQHAPHGARGAVTSSSSLSSLRQEADMVSALRHAVQAGDRTESERISRGYWRIFSAGQLAPEVRRLDSKWREQR